MKQNKPLSIDKEQGLKRKAEQKNYSDFFLQANRNLLQSIDGLEYLRKKGINNKTMLKFNLGYIENWKPEDNPNILQSRRIIIPTSEHSYTAVAVDENPYKIIRQGKVSIFNENALYKGINPLIVTDGELSALSVMQAGDDAIALGSAINHQAFINIVQETLIRRPLIISLDTNSDGVKSQRKLTDNLKKLNVSFYEINTSGNHWSQNEYLQSDQEGFYKTIKLTIKSVAQQEQGLREAKKLSYLKNNAYSYIDNLLYSPEKIYTPTIPTGFEKLDKALCGGLFQGLYIFTSISSLAKTAFLTQMADQIAIQGNDILIFSLETPRTEIIAKSISRISYIKNKNKAKTFREILNRKYKGHNSEESDKSLQKLIEEYSKYADRIYIIEGTGDIGTDQIKKAIQEHIIITGNTPVVIIDYLQIIAPYDIKATDRQNEIKSALELKRISRDLKTPVLAVSASYKQNSNIESSDVLINLKSSATDKDNSVTLKRDRAYKVKFEITKNSIELSSNTIEYDYIQEFDYFKEIKNNKTTVVTTPKKDSMKSDT